MKGQSSSFLLWTVYAYNIKAGRGRCTQMRVKIFNQKSQFRKHFSGT